MAADTNIEWCDHTFNPWIGCTKVSTAATGGGGCDHCYAEASTPARVLRSKGTETWGPHAPRVRTSPANWRQPLAWNAQAEAFAAQHGRRQRVFCASLADVFDNAVDPQWRADLFGLIQRTPNLDWLLLTKRIGNVRSMLAELSHAADNDLTLLDMMPLPNVWIGATIVNQAEADRDIPKLLGVPAHKRFLSMEPLLGPVDLSPEADDTYQFLSEWYGPNGFDETGSQPRQTRMRNYFPRIDWVIAGGESGPGARPMHPDWARSLRDQCAAAGVPFLFKQWGEWHTRAFSTSDGQPVFREFASFQHWVNKASTWVQGGICLDRHGAELSNGGDMARARDAGNFPVTIMHKVAKKAAGRLLDGRTWDGAPTA